MISSSAQVTRLNELQKQKLIIDVIAESVALDPRIEPGSVEPQYPLMHVAHGELEAWYEIIDKAPVVQLRRVYCLSDYDYVKSALHRAKLRWPDNPLADLPTDEPWKSSPAIAIRHCFNGPSPTTGILYQVPGCGIIEKVLPQLEEKIAFLRGEYLDAFLSWIPQYPSEIEAE